jgi:hypothetical protein
VKKIFSIIPLFLLITFGSAKSQWTRTTMNPGTANPFVFSFAVSNNIIYAGCDSGRIFSSSDNGNSWTAVNSGIKSLNVRALAAKSDMVFAATSNAFVVSSDRGVTWHPGNTLTGAHTFTFKGDSLFAGTESDGFFLSTDNGEHWSGQLPGQRIYAFAFPEPNIFAGNFITLDQGKSWVELYSGLGEDNIYSLMNNGSKIFAGTHSGVSFWNEHIVSWVSSLSETGYALSLVQSGSNIFAGTYEKGVFYSSDNGASWNQINPNNGTWWEVYAITIIDNTFFAGTRDGVWRRSLADIGISKVTFPTDINISISPNPTNGIISIHNAPATMMQIEIMNVLGERVSALTNTGTADFKIDLTKFPAGIYFAKFVSGNSVLVRKLLKE